MITRTTLTGKFAEQDTDTIPHYFTELAYKAVPINSVLPYDEWYDNVLTDIISEERFEYIAYDEHNKVAAAMVIVKDYDPVVGDCLSILFAYSTEPNALRRGYKLALQMCRQLGYKHLIYTKLIKGKRYELVYREVDKLPTKPEEFEGV